MAMGADADVAAGDGAMAPCQSQAGRLDMHATNT